MDWRGAGLDGLGFHFCLFTYHAHSIHVWYIYLHLPYKSTKCRSIYRTWMVWDGIPHHFVTTVLGKFFFCQPPKKQTKDLSCFGLFAREFVQMNFGVKKKLQRKTRSRLMLRGKIDVIYTDMYTCIPASFTHVNFLRFGRFFG